MADGCLECEASMCVWLAFSCQGRKCNNLHRICTEKPEMSNFKCQYLPSKKQVETCFFFNPLVFHALSTGDDKSSLNTIDIQKNDMKM